jgi:hypothetical protein
MGLEQLVQAMPQLAVTAAGLIEIGSTLLGVSYVDGGTEDGIDAEQLFAHGWTSSKICRDVRVFGRNGLTKSKN